jgi:hypothetical protein
VPAKDVCTCVVLRLQAFVPFHSSRLKRFSVLSRVRAAFRTVPFLRLYGAFPLVRAEK